MLIEVRFVQPLKAPFSIIVTLLGMLIDISPLCLNVFCPINFTLLGILIEVSPVQS